MDGESPWSYADLKLRNRFDIGVPGTELSAIIDGKRKKRGMRKRALLSLPGTTLPPLSSWPQDRRCHPKIDKTNTLITFILVLLIILINRKSHRRCTVAECATAQLSVCNILGVVTKSAPAWKMVFLNIIFAKKYDFKLKRCPNHLQKSRGISGKFVSRRVLCVRLRLPAIARSVKDCLK